MSDIQELVENAQNQETFSFTEVVQGRGYPRDEVAIYLDEATAYQIVKLEKQIADSLDDQEVDALAEKVAELRKKLAQSKYIFKIVGLSTQTREDLLEKARNDIKPEYDQHKNFITGQVEKVEKESPKRDRYYTNLLWQASIEQIVAPSGAVDTAPTLETVEAFRKAPMSQQVKFQTALNELSVAAEIFEESVDDDFLASSSH